MPRLTSVAVIVLAGLFVAPAYSQPADRAQARPTALDPAAIRREATKLAELRTLLADPDPNVRLLTIREVARNGDAAQRQLAIEAGLSSAEGVLQEAALRALMANVQQIVLQVTPQDEREEGKKREITNLVLSVEKFDPETGRINGRGYTAWNGQIQGGMFTFSNGVDVSGNLSWDAEAGEYRGTVNTERGRISGTRKVSWRPR